MYRRHPLNPSNVSSFVERAVKNKMGRCRLLADFLSNLEAVFARHHDVEDNNQTLRSEFLQALYAVFGPSRFKPLAFR